MPLAPAVANPGIETGSLLPICGSSAEHAPALAIFRTGRNRTVWIAEMPADIIRGKYSGADRDLQAQRMPPALFVADQILHQKT